MTFKGVAAHRLRTTELDLLGRQLKEVSTCPWILDAEAKGMAIFLLVIVIFFSVTVSNQEKIGTLHFEFTDEFFFKRKYLSNRHDMT